VAGGLNLPQGKGGRKALDAELNLVPFIDLLSCCISFLLITAVWTQLSRIDVNQKGPSSQGESTEVPPEQLKLTVVVDDSGYRLQAGADTLLPIPKKDGNYDYATLGQKLAEVKKDHQDKNDITIASDDAVKYDFIVQTMDQALGAGFHDVSLVDVGQAAL
jgi:biopolymer transport protein ExbD